MTVSAFAQQAQRGQFFQIAEIEQRESTFAGLRFTNVSNI